MAAAAESALVSLIKQRREVLLNAAPGQNEQVIFLDNRLTPTPENILRDPSLNPYDKILWQGILSIAQTENPPGTGGAGTVMPTYDHLSRLVNVSRMSIATSIAALRATRWLIVNQIRGEGGAMRGQLYVIAYQPWDLSYALDIDERYIDWLETQTEERRDRRIQRIAQAVWDTIAEDRRSGIDVMAPIDPIQKTFEANKALQDQSGRFYSIGANALKMLSHRDTGRDGNIIPLDHREDGGVGPPVEKAAENRRVRNSYSVSSRGLQPQLQETDGVNPVSDSDRMTTSRSTSSSNYKYKKTTTTFEMPAELSTLSFPPHLKPIEVQRIAKVLCSLIPDQRETQQMLLDELGGRMKWGQGFKGGPAAWFKGTVQACLKMRDDFIPNYADRYASHREQAAAARAEEKERTRPRTASEQQRASEAMALIRENLPNLQSKRRDRP